jgi:xanthine dehydrogenase iron-sulfur cluster and FAD-binding subunit A
MLSWFAARQIRNRATLGGNIATASPIGDLAPVLLALDASVQLSHHAGQRLVAIADFFSGYRQTCLADNEVIEAIIIPRASTSAQRLSFSYKIGKRGTDDISIVAAAFTIDLDTNHIIRHARLAYGGVAATPIRALGVEQWLLGQPWHEQTISEAQSRLSESFSPLSDHRASAHYRKRLIANVFKKFYHDHEAQR